MSRTTRPKGRHILSLRLLLVCDPNFPCFESSSVCREEDAHPAQQDFAAFGRGALGRTTLEPLKVLCNLLVQDKAHWQKGLWGYCEVR
jgi:hypothetical protein